jgi:hypothetical protein
MRSSSPQLWSNGRAQHPDLYTRVTSNQVRVTEGWSTNARILCRGKNLAIRTYARSKSKFYLSPIGTTRPKKPMRRTACVLTAAGNPAEKPTKLQSLGNVVREGLDSDPRGSIVTHELPFRVLAVEALAYGSETHGRGGSWAAAPMVGLAAAGLAIGATGGAIIGMTADAPPAPAVGVGGCTMTIGAVTRIGSGTHKGQLYTWTLITTCNPDPMAIIKSTATMAQQRPSGWAQIKSVPDNCVDCGYLDNEYFRTCPSGTFNYRNQSTGYILEFGDDGGAAANNAGSGVTKKWSC